MSRASYNSWSDKHRVDDAAARNLSLAQALSESIGMQKSQASREQQLGILPPPAKYQSSAEAAADVGHANQQAISTLETFMYPQDAHQAFGDLLKNDQVAEFNQYSSMFKKALGDRKISFIEFQSLWFEFINRLSESKSVETLGYFNKEAIGPSISGLLTAPETVEIDKSIDALPTKAAVVKFIKSNFNNNVAPHLQISDKFLRQYTVKNPKDGYGLEDLKEIVKNKIHVYKDEIKEARTARATSNFGKLVKGAVKKERMSHVYEYRAKEAKRKMQIAKNRAHSLDEAQGEGLHHRARIHGRGISPNLTKEQAIHRFKICQGEVLAGNDNPQLLHETRELITKLTKEGYLKYTNK